jgi:hypothetical protein
MAAGERHKLKMKTAAANIDRTALPETGFETTDHWCMS